MPTEIRPLMGMKAKVRHQGIRDSYVTCYLMETRAMVRGIEAEKVDHEFFKVGIINDAGGIDTAMFWCHVHDITVLDTNLTPGITAIHDYYESFDS